MSKIFEHLYCEKCNKGKIEDVDELDRIPTLHMRIKEGHFYRENVMFMDTDCNNMVTMVPYSGFQKGLIYECLACGEERMYGSDEDLREVGSVNWKLYEKHNGDRALMFEKRFPTKYKPPRGVVAESEQ